MSHPDADLLRRLADACEGTESGQARFDLCREARARADELDLAEAFAAESPAPKPQLPAIYVWVNRGQGTDFQTGMAMAEDGEYLAGHVSSSRDWFRRDMGLLDSPDGIGAEKRELYAKKYPGGYVLQEVQEGQEATHAGLRAAYELNQKCPKAGE